MEKRREGRETREGDKAEQFQMDSMCCRAGPSRAELS